MEKERLIQFIKTLPESKYAIGYGSGVKSQANDKGLKKQIDLILVVENKEEWLRETFYMHPEFFNKLGYKILSMYESKTTDIDYLTYLPFENQVFKVGVISSNYALDDLIMWKNFNLAGRLQKDVEIIQSGLEFDKAIEINRLNALKVALLLLNNGDTEEDLYKTLCSLSFIGDLRNIFKIENPNKISNIVNGSFNELRTIYNNLNNSYYDINKNNLNINYNAITADLESLPTQLLTKIEKLCQKKLSKKDLLEIRKNIINFFRKKNLRNSTVQPLRGIILNGFPDSYNYLTDKLMKKKAEFH